MKIPKAKLLPSGNWNVSVMVDGKRVSVTALTKRQAENEAAALKSGAKSAARASERTVGDAIDRYIDSKDAILSPSTVNGYRKLRKAVFPELMSVCRNLALDEQMGKNWAHI